MIAMRERRGKSHSQTRTRSVSGSTRFDVLRGARYGVAGFIAVKRAEMKQRRWL
jgi:hypothetical protein